MSYNASLGTTTQKPIALSNSNPLDFRSYFYDAVLFKSRPYQSVQEVLLHLTDPKNRAGHFPIFVSSGALQADGSFVGGLIKKYWFKNGTTDGDLIEDVGQSGGTSNITVNLVAPDATGNISISSYDNEYFDDGVTTKTTTNKVYRVGQTVAGLLDVNNLPVTYSHTSGGIIDGAIIRKKGTEFFKRNFQGPANAKWWGAKGDGVTDDWAALQAAIDSCQANGIPSLYIPSGRYKISKPLIISFFYSGNYVGVTLELFGDSDMWPSGYATSIEATFTNTFLLGIQNGKGCTIRNLSFTGKFTSPTFANDYAYYRSDFATYTDGVCRDSRYSPYSAIVIDPFTRGGIPADGGYPGLSAWYKGTGGQNGSTATTIDSCTIEKTVVGICSSPNGSTRNAEITSIRNVRFGNHKLCVSGGQDQEKTSSIYNAACWNGTHTFFATGKYGTGSAGHWDVERVNMAGRAVQFIDNDQQGRFPTTVKDIYAEGLGRWGYIQNNTGQASAVRDCIIGLAYPDSAGLQVLISGDGTYYDNCTFRYYGHNGLPMQLTGENTYSGCVFSGFPIFSGQYWYPRFIDCRANGAFLGLTGIKTYSGGTRYHTYGEWTLDVYNTDHELKAGADRGLKVQARSSSQEIYTSIASDSNVAITVNGMSLSFESANPLFYSGFCLLEIGGNWASVTGIQASTITASYNDPNMASGNYNINSYHPIYFAGILIGDITAGNNQIENCKSSSAWWWTLVNIVGMVIKNPYGGSKYIKITGVSGTTVFFVGSITSTKTGAIFGNYTSQEIFTDYPNVSAYPAGYIVRRGDKIITQKGSENSIEYIITKGGFLSGDADTRQATMTASF